MDVPAVPAVPAVAAVAAVAAPSTASERTVEDGEATMGIGTSRTMERVAAALGQLDQAELHFLPSDDVPHGGLLCALPALLAMGLLRHAGSHFQLPKGFHPLEGIFMLIACLAPATNTPATSGTLPNFPPMSTRPPPHRRKKHPPASRAWHPAQQRPLGA